jgi:hypothetical protein
MIAPMNSLRPRGIASALPPLRLRDINLFQTMNVQLRSQKRSN